MKGRDIDNSLVYFFGVLNIGSISSLASSCKALLHGFCKVLILVQLMKPVDSQRRCIAFDTFSYCREFIRRVNEIIFGMEIAWL